jgi:hypothetical protein
VNGEQSTVYAVDERLLAVRVTVSMRALRRLGAFEGASSSVGPMRARVVHP